VHKPSVITPLAFTRLFNPLSPEGRAIQTLCDSYRTLADYAETMAVDQIFALLEVFAACFLFGSVYVPMKRFNLGDGRLRLIFLVFRERKKKV
jgi:hypothetical protein